MRNKIIASLILSACNASALYAGGMGPVGVEMPPAFTPFISGEASYTWPNIYGLNGRVGSSLTEVTSNTDTKGWGGRFAVGMMRAWSERFAYSGEIGWGYYGNSTVRPVFHVSGADVIPPTDSASLALDQYGFDLLAGILYTQPKYDLFFKAGALFMNSNVRFAFNPHEVLRGNSRQDDFIEGKHIKTDAYMPTVMPEIKLGAAYHVSEHWLANVSWMHAFGGAFGASGYPLVFSPITRIGDVTFDFHNPSLNTVMFGLEYRFA